MKDNHQDIDTTKIAGLYLHVPFCKKKCSYCDFYSQTNMGLQEKYIKAITKEMKLCSSDWASRDFASVYFGGGTPSTLKPKDLEILVQNIYKNFNILPDAEISIELNPEGVDESFAYSLKQIGFNRISLGIQSFSNDLLHNLGRIHSAEKAKYAIECIKKAGFENISIDLMFGLPDLESDAWERTLETAFGLNVQHFSAYILGLEPQTKMFNDVDAGKISLPEESVILCQYNLLCELANKNGYEHYEISNFAQSGFESTHNNMYWAGNSYLGLGPSAHSYDGNRCRSWNESNIDTYITKLSIENIMPSKSEVLSISDRINDVLITRFRTAIGLDLTWFGIEFGNDTKAVLLDKATKDIKTKLLILNNNKLRIAEPHLVLSDRIIRDLLF